MAGPDRLKTALLPRIKRLPADPYSAGRQAYERGEPFDPDFGLKFADWPPISAQCLYEIGRLSAAGGSSVARGGKRRRHPKLRS
jgi:hypothetical protein